MAEAWENWAVVAPPTPGAASGEAWADWPVIAEATAKTATGEGPGIVKGMAKSFGRGATVGLSDKMIAKADASTRDMLPRNPRLQGISTDANEVAEPITTGTGTARTKEAKAADYNQSLASERRDADRFFDEHPYLATGANAAGMLATAPFLPIPARAATMAGNAGRGAATGAAYGGVGGAAASDANNPMQFAKDVGVGAALGGAVGTAAPVIAETVGPRIGRFMGRGDETQARREIAGRMAQDAQAGGATAESMGQRLAEPGAEQLAIADVAGKNVKRELGAAARAPGPAAEQVSKTLADRDFGSGKRISEVVAGEDPFVAAQKLVEQRSADARPAYDAAFKGSAPISETNAIVKMIDDRLATAKGGIKEALTKARGLFQNANGEIDTSLRGLHETKMALDDMISSAGQTGMGRTAKGELVGIKRSLVDAMDSGSGGLYRVAREKFAGPSAAKDALEEGGAFLKKSPAQIRHELSELTASEREFYEMGGAGAIREMVSRTASTADEAAKILGSQHLQEQIRSVLPKDVADRLIKTAQNEQTMFQTRREVMPSKLGSEAAEGGRPSSGLGKIAIGTAAFLKGEPVYGLRQGAEGVAQLVGNARNVTPEVRAEIGKMLTETDPTKKREILAKIMAEQNRPNIAGRVAAPLAGSAGQQYGNLTR